MDILLLFLFLLHLLPGVAHPHAALASLICAQISLRLPVKGPCVILVFHLW